MTTEEIIRLIGDVLTELDVLSTSVKIDNETKQKLNDKRDELDTLQRKLSRAALHTNTGDFKKLASDLNESNQVLQQTIGDIKKIADTLETLVNFIEAVQNIAELVSAV